MIKKLDLERKFKTYGDIANEREATGKMQPDVKYVAEKINEIIEFINQRDRNMAEFNEANKRL